MVRKLLWVVPLVLALSTVVSDARPTPRPSNPPRPTPTSAPEFDPSASGAALALLLGGAWLLSERRRRGPERG